MTHQGNVIKRIGRQHVDGFEIGARIKLVSFFNVGRFDSRVKRKCVKRYGMGARLKRMDKVHVGRFKGRIWLNRWDWWLGSLVRKVIASVLALEWLGGANLRIRGDLMFVSGGRVVLESNQVVVSVVVGSRHPEPPNRAGP